MKSIFKDYDKFISESSFPEGNIVPSPSEIAVFEKMLQNAMDAVDELWESEKYSTVILRCDALDYRYEKIRSEMTSKERELVRFPNVKPYDKERAIARLSQFILDGTKGHWGDKASLMLFRVGEIARDGIEHYKFEYDWNNDTSTIDLVQERSGEESSPNSGYYQLNQESGKIAAVIYEHLCKHPYIFPERRGMQIGRKMGITESEDDRSIFKDSKEGRAYSFLGDIMDQVVRQVGSGNFVSAGGDEGWVFMQFSMTVKVFTGNSKKYTRKKEHYILLIDCENDSVDLLQTDTKMEYIARYSLNRAKRVNSIEFENEDYANEVAKMLSEIGIQIDLRKIRGSQLGRKIGITEKRHIRK